MHMLTVQSVLSQAVYLDVAGAPSGSPLLAARAALPSAALARRAATSKGSSWVSWIPVAIAGWRRENPSSLPASDRRRRPALIHLRCSQVPVTLRCQY